MLLLSHSVMFNSSLQHTRLLCPSSSPGICSSSGPMNQWYQPTISPSVTLFSFCLQSFLASGSFPMSQLFTSGGQSTGASASASVLPKSIQGWFTLRLTGLIALLSKGFLRVCSSTTVQKRQFFSAPLCPALTSVHDYWKDDTLTVQTFAGKMMSLICNTLSRFLS